VLLARISSIKSRGASQVRCLGPIILALFLARSAAADPLPTWAEPSPRYFLVGVAFERGDDNLVGKDFFGDQLIGITATYRSSMAGLGGRLMISPKFERANFFELRALGGLDARAYIDVLGLEWSLGLGILVEARLRDHFWLSYLTPLEIGATVFEHGSLQVQAFAGVRYLYSGSLINTFLLDPNGFNNENAVDALADERDRPWEIFLRIAFTRRID
jgi:hypothetical protein